MTCEIVTQLPISVASDIGRGAVSLRPAHPGPCAQVGNNGHLLTYSGPSDPSHETTTSVNGGLCNCRCSPYIIINKLVESNSWTSDSNTYFPVPPCEYGGPREALAAGDYKAVFVMAEPEKIPRHNFYEALWFMKTGLPRMVSDYMYT